MFKKVKLLPVMTLGVCCLGIAIGNDSAIAWTTQDCANAQTQCNKTPAWWYSGCANFSSHNNTTPFWMGDDSKTGFNACNAIFQSNQKNGCQAGYNTCVSWAGKTAQQKNAPRPR